MQESEYSLFPQTGSEMKSFCQFAFAFLLLCSSLFGNGSWYFQDSGVTNDLFGVYFLDTLQGWVCGDSGVILHTIDGGDNWELQPTPTTRELKDIFFIDPNNGWSVGDSGVIIHTSNGGINWETQESPVTDTLQAVIFDSLLTGWGCGNHGTMIYTSDGGQHWSGQSGGYGNFYAISFVYPHEGWVVFGGDEDICSTTDGGRVWWYGPPISPYKIRDLTATGLILYQEQPRIWLVGLNGFAAWGYYYDPYSSFWALEIAFTPDTLDLFGISPNSDFSKIWAVGENGWIIFSSDTGQNYENDTTVTNACLYDVTFPYLEIGWAVGAQGTILHHSLRAPGISYGEIKKPSKLLMTVVPSISGGSFRLKYGLPVSAKVCLQIFDAKGQMVKTLVNDFKEKGEYGVLWNGRDKQNNIVSSGIYLCKLQTGNQCLTKKVLFCKERRKK